VIKQKDGIHIGREKNFIADSRKEKGDANIVSHAHMDHVHKAPNPVICSDLTAKLAEARTGIKIETVKHSNVRLLDSGHILGSSAALIKTDGKRVLYTGDVSTRDRAYIKGFKPVKADILITESTYGLPPYLFPDQKEIEREIIDWIQDNKNRPLYLSAYSLGKAQKIQYLVKKAVNRPLIVHGSVKKMNDIIEKHTSLEFNVKPYKENKNLLKSGEGIFVGPTSFSNKDFLNNLVKNSNGLKAGFSGWCITGAYGYGRYDKSFPFSDHCDFGELVNLVRDVNPEKVYTHHGFDAEFASYLKREEGFNARSLKTNQTSLTDF